MNRNRQNTNEVKKWMKIHSPDNIQWVRPSDWLALPAVNVGDEKFVGLYAVYDTVGSNVVAVQCQGAYDVDWGDGNSSLNVTSNAVAEHAYNYSDLASGTLCSRGYRQAIITITPHTGSHLTKIQIDNRHSTMSNAYTAPWLDIKLASSYLTTHSIYVANNVFMRMLESYEFVGTNGISSFVNFFAGCFALQKVLIYTNSGTTFSYMFNSCYSLKQCPVMNTSAANDFSGMFYKCFNLVDVPLLDTHQAITFSNMFYQCQTIREIPNFNSVAVLNWQGIFYQCQALEEVPLFNTSAGTNFSSMFNGCFALRSIPLFDTANGLTFAGMFYNCYSLMTIPLLNTAKGTNFSSMFYGCSALQTIPLIDTHLGTNMASMFIYCPNLSYIPLLNMAANTDFSNMFNSCLALIVLPLLVVAAGTTFASMFASCLSIQKGSLSGITRSISFLNNKMSHDMLVDLFNNLGTASGAQTLTITGNPGVATLTAPEQAIATGKGWTLAL